MNDYAEFARAFVARYEQRPPLWAAVLCVAEEAGEFVGAYRRSTGWARRAGTAADVAEELADVVIAAYTAAELAGIDLDAAVASKQAVVMDRPVMPA